MRAFIFANGRMRHSPAPLCIRPKTDLIIAADGGLKHCRRWAIRPHLVIGDLDSADPADIRSLAGEGTEVIRHPARKDQTDLELAIDAAARRGATDILLLGALGERWDMTLANVLILASPTLTDLQARIWDGPTEISCLTGPAALTVAGRPGQRLSLMPITQQVTGVNLTGLAYPLSDHTLEMGTTRGISNQFKAGRAEIRVGTGRILVVIDRS